MRIILVFMVVLLVSCAGEEGRNAGYTDSTSIEVTTQPQEAKHPPAQQVEMPAPAPNPQVNQDTLSTKPLNTYANTRFKDVTVEKVGTNKYLIKGKGQIFEASFSWVVEDGHDELKQGHEMTNAGAPEWGDFSFTVEVEKKRSNSTLHIILYEVSARDGSRQHELPIFLY